MTKISEITECSECGSKSLTWGTHYKTNSGVPEGRLRSSEVQCLFVLGCDECSETLAIVSADKVAAALSAQQSAQQSAHVSVPREFGKFADKIMAKLIRFADCAEDPGAGGVDIGRDWLDTLTRLGLLERVQRSPALWQTTDEADAIIEAQRALLNGGEA